MRRALNALFVLSTVAALLVPPAAAGVVWLPGGHKSDKGHDCACCRSGETATNACCQGESGDRPVQHQNDCGSCPLGHCCGCCAVGAPTLVPSGTSVIAAPELATPLLVPTDRLTTRSDEPLLPPPIA